MKNYIKSLNFLNYDVLSPGNNLLLENKNFLETLTSRYGNKILSSNSNIYDKKYISKKTKSFNVNIFNYISPGSFTYFKVPSWFSYNTFPEKNIIYGNGLNILIYHGWFSDLEKEIKNFQNFQLILLSHDQQLNTWELDGITVVGAGEDAKYVVVIDVQNASNEYKFNVSFEKMNDSIHSHSSIVSLSDKFNEQVNKIMEASK